MSLITFDKTTVSLVRQSCIECGIVFAVDAEWDAQRRNDHKAFHCPNGHSQYYNGKSEAEKLREALEVERKNKTYWIETADRRQKELQHQRFKTSAERGAKTKLKNKLARVHKGVCPECSRTFNDLQRHMKTKHPTSCSSNGKPV